MHLNRVYKTDTALKIPVTVYLTHLPCYTWSFSLSGPGYCCSVSAESFLSRQPTQQNRQFLCSLLCFTCKQQNKILHLQGEMWGQSSSWVKLHWREILEILSTHFNQWKGSDDSQRNSVNYYNIDSNKKTGFHWVRICWPKVTHLYERSFCH